MTSENAPTPDLDRNGCADEAIAPARDEGQVRSARGIAAMTGRAVVPSEPAAESDIAELLRLILARLDASSATPRTRKVDDGASPRLPAGPGRSAAILSPREREIARLVAAGHGNKTIARILDISAWTVAAHLRRVFAKLEVASRAEMVARVVEADLLGDGGQDSA